VVTSKGDRSVPARLDKGMHPASRARSRLTSLRTAERWHAPPVVRSHDGLYPNAPGRIRTCDLRIRSPLLYPD
jgi:hypothetical protein